MANEMVHISDIGFMDPYDPYDIPDDVGVLTKNSYFYVNKLGQPCEAYEYVGKTGEVVWSGVSTNVPVCIIDTSKVS